MDSIPRCENRYVFRIYSIIIYFGKNGFPFPERNNISFISKRTLFRKGRGNGRFLTSNRYFSYQWPFRNWRYIYIYIYTVIGEKWICWNKYERYFGECISYDTVIRSNDDSNRLRSKEWTRFSNFPIITIFSHARLRKYIVRNEMKREKRRSEDF